MNGKNRIDMASIVWVSVMISLFILLLVFGLYTKEKPQKIQASQMQWDNQV